ncbi:hypothetical protein MTYP_01353 [Methylophilaceae bacterium]|nr:hypothetical protein MTYP_01353 [Methylophilaceae bacterium]
MLAIVFASLAPAVSHAFAARSAPLTLWQEICTAQGTKMIASVITQPADHQENLADQPMQPHMGALEHCPFCFSHAGAVGVPPGNHVLFVAELNAADAVDVYQSPLIQRYFQSAHLSRAPPVSLS